MSLLSVQRKVEIQGATANGLIEVREQVTEDVEFIFIINHSIVDETVQVRVKTQRRGRIECIYGKEEPGISVNENGVLFDLAIPAGETVVMSIRG